MRERSGSALPGIAPTNAYLCNDGRVRRCNEIDAAIGHWTRDRSRDDVLQQLDAVGVPVGRIYSVADIAADPQYHAREMLLDATTSDGQRLTVPGVVPKLSATPGGIRRAAPRLGEHTADLQGAGWPERT